MKKNPWNGIGIPVMELNIRVQYRKDGVFWF